MVRGSPTCPRRLCAPWTAEGPALSWAAHHRGLSPSRRRVRWHTRRLDRAWSPPPRRWRMLPYQMALANSTVLGDAGSRRRADLREPGETVAGVFQGEPSQGEAWCAGGRRRRWRGALSAWGLSMPLWYIYEWRPSAVDIGLPGDLGSGRGRRPADHVFSFWRSSGAPNASWHAGRRRVLRRPQETQRSKMFHGPRSRPDSVSALRACAE